MINVAVISPDERTLEALAGCLSEIAGDTIRQLREYPSVEDAEHLLEAVGDAVILLDFTDYHRALRLAAQFDACGRRPGPIAVFHGVVSRECLMELMQAGVRQVISAPFRRQEVCGAITQALQNGRRDHGALNGEVHAFLPAKPGSGATTVCTSVAAAVGRMGGSRALLLDFDLRLGVTSFLLKLHNAHSVVDALSNAGRLDPVLWKQLAGQREELDILGSAPAHADQHFRLDDYGLVLNYARGAYHKICVDLPGNMDDYELDTLRRAAHIYLVLTADVTSLHMAKRKTALLNSLQVHTPISAVLNFAGRRGSLSAGEIEEIIQAPVRFALPADERAVSDAVRDGNPIRDRTPLGKELEKIAREIVAARAGDRRPTEGARRFVEYFSISRERRSEMWA